MATATYRGGYNVAMLWSAYHCVHGIPCLCTLSASAFIEPSLHQLDFFLKSFYGDLFLFFFGMRLSVLWTRGSERIM